MYTPSDLQAAQDALNVANQNLKDAEHAYSKNMLHRWFKDSGNEKKELAYAQAQVQRAEELLETITAALDHTDQKINLEKSLDEADESENNNKIAFIVITVICVIVLISKYLFK